MGIANAVDDAPVGAQGVSESVGPARHEAWVKTIRHPRLVRADEALDHDLDVLETP